MSYGTVQANLIQGSVNSFSPNSSVFRNRIINGGMTIDQRNSGASFTATDGGYSLDRWKGNSSQVSKFTIQQNAASVTPPAGFINYLGVTSSAATSVGASDYYLIRQAIEGFNASDLNFGTANAKSVTLSFWVRSSLTGTFAGTLNNSAANRSYPYTYTISSANTWEQKSITIAGDTSGTWLTNSGIGLWVSFSLGMGSTYSGTAGAWAGSELYSATGATSVVGTNGATFFLTGCQLEIGSTATSFDYRPYGTELALCQRYYFKMGGNTQYEAIGAGNLSDSASIGYVYVKYPVAMRAVPTASYSSLQLSNNADYNLAVSSIRGQYNGLNASNIGFNCSSNGTTYAAVQLQTATSGGFIAYSSEL